MTAPALDAMLRLVREHEARECAAVRDRAAAEADALVHAAWSENRARLHRTVGEVRATMRAEIAQADAALDTAHRRHRARCEFALLEGATEPLRAALCARWQDAPARRRWTGWLLGEAQRLLPAGEWEIVHAAGWSAAERAAAGAHLARAQLPPARFREDSAIAAGLRIHLGGACLDGTLDGLLADREAISGRLLAALAAPDTAASAGTDS